MPPALIDRLDGDEALTAHDLFCGFGGSSEGARRAGLRLRLGLNHWNRAVEVHGMNFPEADHDCTDASAVDPRRYPPARILIAGPECTNHSSSKGVSRKLAKRGLLEHPDPSAERSRATMWDVVRFTEVHRYLAVIVENVVDVIAWELFNPWVAAMEALGYQAQVVYMNSMVAPPTPQSRDRAYIVFWRKRARRPNLRFDVPCYCPRCERIVQGIQTFKNPRKPWGKLGDHKRNQYVYVCPDCAMNPQLARRAVDAMAYPLAYGAGSGIDWSIEAPLIGDRARLGLPRLVPSTLRRIENGLRKVYGDMLVQVYGHTFERDGYARAWPVRAPSPAQTATLDRALVIPVSRSNDPDGRRARPVSEPVFTQTARQDMGLAIPLPFIVNSYGTAEQPWPVDRPAGAVTANGNHHYLTLPPMLVANYGNGTTPGKHGWVRPVGLPAGTVTATDHHALLIPSGGTWNEDPRPVRNPAATVTTTEAYGLLEPELGPLLASYYGNDHGQVRPVGMPASTVESRDRHALIDPPALRVEDCGYRMIKPHEIRAFMAFPDDYLIEDGMSDKEQVRGYGNAVTPPVMELLVARVLEALGA
jgi:DNA (cytosine-5)-methyltransferase 1